MKKRILSAILSLLITTSAIPTISFAENTDDDHLLIEASYANPITINKVAESVEEITGDLSISKRTYRLNRDYAQKCYITVVNNSDNSLKYYLGCNNIYEDIYMNFVKSGSKEEPLIIHAGETQSIELSVFMQNAEKTTYQIPITAYVVDKEEKIETVSTISIICDQPEFNVDCSLTNMDEATLTHTYKLTNNGDELSDIHVYIEGEAEDYAKFMPVISNLELGWRESVEFKVAPDLTKMKTNEKSLISGTMVIKCGGQSKEIEVTFDTKGQEITTTTMGELALIQDGNPYVDLEFDEDNLKFITAANGTEITFSEITAKYYEEGSTEKDGVNTAEEFKEVIDEIINPETGMMDFTIENTLTTEAGNMPLSVNVSSELVSKPDVSLMSEELDYEIYYYTDDTLKIRYKLYITPQEYAEFVKPITDAAGYLDIKKLPENILSSVEFDNEIVDESTKL